MAFSSNGGGRGAPLSEINVTPLVDVMLVLLIIFMITAPMLTTGIDVDLPNAEAPRQDVDEDTPLIVIALIPPEEREEGGPISTIYFFGEEVSLEELRRQLDTDERVRERSEVFVQGDESVPYGEVVKVLAQIRQAGVEKMGLVTDPLERE